MRSSGDSTALSCRLGDLFSWPSHRTWEFRSGSPIRSVVPLYLFYGLPMLAMKGIGALIGLNFIVPASIFYGLRLVMAASSILLIDSAVFEVVEPAQCKPAAVLLVASSYVTWTWQSHTFSNSIETILILWSLVLIKQIKAVCIQIQPVYRQANRHSPLVAAIGGLPR